MEIATTTRRIKYKYMGKTYEDYDSRVYWNRWVHSGVFITKDGCCPRKIEIPPENDPEFRFSVAHEFAHILDIAYTDASRLGKDDIYAARTEVRAWRIAKSFVKPELWGDEGDLDAKKSLYGYFEIAFGKKRTKRIIERLKIIPLLRKTLDTEIGKVENRV